MRDGGMRLCTVSVVLAGVFCTVACGKTGPTYWTAARVAELRESAKKNDADLQQCLQGTGANFHGTVYFSADTLAGLSDEQLWNLMPPTTIKRALDVSQTKGCAVHGQEIRKFGSYYPWRFDCLNHPYKVQCPVGGEWYPSNDYAAGDMTSGEYPDDGSGCKIGDDTYQFIQHYTYAAFLTCVRPGIYALARAYAYTGEARYAHACAVMLARVAREYPNATDKRDRAYSGRYGHISGMIADCVWATDTLNKLAEAYDLLYDYLPGDAELMRFLAGKEASIGDAQSYRRYVEDNILRAGGQAAFDRAVMGNTGMVELTIATVALILDDLSDRHPNSRDMLEWLYRGEGGMLYVDNQLYKDGSSYESMSYNGARRGYIWALERAEMLQKLHPDDYPLRDYPILTDNPKFKALTTFHSRASCLGRYRPEVGDAGSGMKTPTEPPKRTLPNQTESDLLDGFGLGILRQGSGESQRALWLFYGGPLGHRHDDPLNLGLMGYGYDLLPELGYPAHWRYRWCWESSIAGHNTVIVDGVTQTSRLIAGHADYFTDGPGFSAMAAQHNPYPYDRQYRPDYPHMKEYQRCCALVGISDDDYYVFDLFRVTGGVYHQLCWHGPDTEGDMAYEGPALAAQATGSVAGPDIERGTYYRDSTGRMRHDVFGWMKNVRRGPGDAPAQLDWPVKDAGDTHLSMHLLPEADTELALASGVPPAQPTRYTADFAVLARGTPPAPEPWISGDRSEIVIQAEDFAGFDSTDEYFWETKGWVQLIGGHYLGGFAALAYKPDKTITCDRYRVPAGDYKLFLMVHNYNSACNRVRVEVNGVAAEVGWEPLPLSDANVMDHWTRGVIVRGVPAGNDLKITTVQADQMAVVIDQLYLTTDLIADAPPSAHPLLSRVDRDQEQLQSRFVTVIEPYQARKHIAGVRRLDAAGQYTGAAVELADGRRDLVLASETPEQPVTADGCSLTGELAMVRRRGDAVEAAHLLTGSALSCGSCTITVPAGKEIARIAAVDRGANAVTVSPPLAAPQLLAGRWVRVYNEFRSGMYRVTEAHNAADGTVIAFEATANLSKGQAAGFRQGRIRNAYVPVPFAGTVQRGDGTLDLTNAWFRGSWLSDEGNRNQWQVEGVLVNQAYGAGLHASGYYDVVLREKVDANSLQRALAPANRFVLWDYGVGDSVEIAHTVHLQAAREGAWRLTTSGPVTVTVPQAPATLRMRAQGGETWLDVANPLTLDSEKLTTAEWEIALR